jgi:hypothetical protein
MARFKARSPNKPALSSIILEGSGVPTGVVVAKVELAAARLQLDGACTAQPFRNVFDRSNIPSERFCVPCSCTWIGCASEFPFEARSNSDFFMALENSSLWVRSSVWLIIIIVIGTNIFKLLLALPKLQISLTESFP